MCSFHFFTALTYPSRWLTKLALLWRRSRNRPRLKADSAPQNALWSSNASRKDNAVAFWRGRHTESRWVMLWPLKSKGVIIELVAYSESDLYANAVCPWGGYRMYSGCHHKCSFEILKNYLGFYTTFLHSGMCQRVSWSSLKAKSFEYETLCSLEKWL